MNEDEKPYGKWVAKLARLKFRFGRGQSYVSIVNTMLLLILTFHLSNLILIIIVGIGTLLGVFMVGLLDDRMKLIHAESDHNVEETTPYFAKLKADVTRIKEMLEKQEKNNGNA